MKEAKQKSILIMEDDQSLLDAIEHQFIMSGFNVFTAKDVEEGLLKIEAIGTVDVIWLDHYLLGKKNGLDFVIKMKNKKEWKNIPIFVVSNSSGSQNIQSYMRLGVTQYYTKADYDLGQIISDMNYTLENENGEENGEEKEENKDK